MKKYDYILISIMVIADAVLFWFRGCRLDTVLFVVWLGIIAVFIVYMKRLDKKKREQQEIRRALSYLKELYPQ